RDPEPPLADRLRETVADASPDQLLPQTLQHHLVGLDSLTERITTELFEHAVDVLAAGERIVWRGVGPSACLAQYAQILSQRIGRSSCTWTHTGTSFADELLQLQPGDTVVVFAYGRLQRHVRVLLDRATALGSRVVLITDAHRPSLGEQVDAVLE